MGHTDTAASRSAPAAGRKQQEAKVDAGPPPGMPVDDAHLLPILPQLPGTWEAQQTMIREAAYFHAQERGFEPGHALDDWLVAEIEINHCLNLP